MKHIIKFITSLFLSLFCLIPLASASASNTSPSAEIFLQLGHAEWVTSVSFSPDGRYIVFGSTDNTVKLFLTQLDPYTESKPIHDPTWFYGRDKIMQRLPAILLQGQHIGILGLRKVGKTSLIKQIQQRFIETPTVYIDCQAFSPKAEIYFEEILKQLRAELLAWKIRGLPPVTQLLDLEDFRKQFLVMFELWIKSGRQEPFLIILDAIDKFFPSREVKDSESIRSEYVRFFRVLRGLAQSHQ